MTTAAPIVVGIDGGPASVSALEVAIQEARLRGIHVLAITCWPARNRRDDAGSPICRSAAEASDMLEDVIAEARLHKPGDVMIVREISQSLPAPALVSASGNAALLVLGSTTRGAGARHHGHHVINHCLRYSGSPVVVVPWTYAAFDELDFEIELQSHSPA